MNPHDIGKAYDQITHLWDDKVFDRSNGMAQHRRAIKFVAHRGKALDVGCGRTGRFIELLLNEGFSPQGLDISEEMLKLAQQRHPEIRFHQHDVCQWRSTETFDFITAWDSIWHIPLSQQKHVLRRLVESLNAHGILIFSFGGTQEENSHVDDFMGPQVYYSSLGVTGFLKQIMHLKCICRHLEFEEYPGTHAYLIVQKC